MPITAASIHPTEVQYNGGIYTPIGSVEDQLDRINKSINLALTLGGPIATELEIFIKSHTNLKFLVTTQNAASQFVPSSFLTLAGASIGIVFWDPTQVVHFWVNGTKNITISNEEIKKGAFIIKKTYYQFDGTVAEIPEWVCLFHEIGHARQCTENQQDFLDKLHNADLISIERDNLIRHENPMMRHAGLPLREDYFGQSFSSGLDPNHKGKYTRLTKEGTAPQHERFAKV